MGYDTTRRDGHCIASRPYDRLCAGTTRSPRPLPRFMPDRRALRHLRGASRRNRQHRNTRPQIRHVYNQALLYHSPPPIHKFDVQNLTDACTGNAAILKGGKESARTAAELARTIQAALARTTGRSHRPSRCAPKSPHCSLRPVHQPIHRAWDSVQYADTGDGPCRWALRDIP